MDYMRFIYFRRWVIVFDSFYEPLKDSIFKFQTMIGKTIFIFILALGYFFTGQAQVVHKPAEILQTMKNSKLSYVTEELYIDINDKDYSDILNATNIYHEDSEGVMLVKKLVLAKEAETEWNAAEKAFTIDSNLKEARKHYKNVFDLQPDYYPAKIRIGQTYEKEKDYEKAIASYKQVIGRNYVDYLPHLLIAEAYRKEKAYEDAVNEITVAHILDRNNPEILQSLIDIYADANLLYDDWVFLPQVKVFKGQKANEIKVMSKASWTGYAIGTAVWNFEPGYAESQQEKPGIPSVLQEKECLLSLAAAQDENKPSNDKGIENLLKAKENKQIESFIYYEEFLRGHPSMVYQLPNNVIKKIKTYVLLAHAGIKPGK